jgi:hypothetical protein
MLMKPEHIKVEALSTKSLPAEIVERVGQDKPALVFIAVLPPGGLVQVRYLCRRLRKRFADLPLLVGYWGRVRDFDGLFVSLRAAGATYVTTSLIQTRTRIRALLNLKPPEGAAPPRLEQTPRPVSSARA